MNDRADSTSAGGRVGEATPVPDRPAGHCSPSSVITLPGTFVEMKDSIGPYKLVQRIGEGGFGDVFMAEQREPIRRLVALKILKPGMESCEIIARFETERQALSLMDHPNIAKVLDAGETEAGRPYFVMELVRGEPITQYCDKNHLPVKDRLVLFMLVCQAVQHAHQKGVIHRDLKPSNVLVAVVDGKPEPKVIDFGIAKALDQPLTDHTLHTRLNQLIGTPEYMSPEQAEMTSLDIDTRSDIYSLGVLLYQLLTGTTPLEASELYSGGYGEMRRIIREVEPQRPSSRVGQMMRETAPFPDEDIDERRLRPPTIVEIARWRATDPATLARSLRGDLDWITAKTLEKDRTRRYESADALGMDILRFLCDEPVSVSPPTLSYKLVKFARRNRVMVTWAIVALTAVLAAMAMSLAFAVSQARARTAVEQQRDAALSAMIETCRTLEANHGLSDPATRQAITQLSTALDQAGKPADAAHWRATIDAP